MGCRARKSPRGKPQAPRATAPVPMCWSYTLAGVVSDE